MPGQSEAGGFVAEMIGLFNTLPHIAGLAPNQWLAVALMVAVIGRFLIGSPNRNR